MATSTVNVEELTQSLLAATQGAVSPAGTPPAPRAQPRHPLSDPQSQEFQALAREHELDPVFMGKLMQAESNFNPRAVSKAGAQGLLQLMPATQKQYNVTDPFDPVQNVPAGFRYYRTLLQQHGGDHARAIAAWNAGPAVVKQYGGVPPYAETQELIRKVLGPEALDTAAADTLTTSLLRAIGAAPAPARQPPPWPRAMQPTPTQRRYVPGTPSEPYPVAPVAQGPAPALPPQRPAPLGAGRQGPPTPTPAQLASGDEATLAREWGLPSPPPRDEPLQEPGYLPDIAHGLRQGGAFVAHQVGNLAMILNKATGWTEPLLGVLGEPRTPNRLAQGEQILRQVEETLRVNPEVLQERNGLDQVLARAVGQAIPALAEFALAVPLVGPIAAGAAIGGLSEADKGVLATTWGALKGAAFMKAQQVVSALPTALRVPGMAALGGGAAALEGASTQEQMAQALVQAGLALPGGPRPPVRESYQRFSDYLDAELGRRQTARQAREQGWTKQDIFNEATAGFRAGRSQADVASGLANKYGLTPEQAQNAARMAYDLYVQATKRGFGVGEEPAPPPGAEAPPGPQPGPPPGPQPGPQPGPPPSAPAGGGTAIPVPRVSQTYAVQTARSGFSLGYTVEQVATALERGPLRMDPQSARAVADQVWAELQPGAPPAPVAESSAPEAPSRTTPPPPEAPLAEVQAEVAARLPASPPDVQGHVAQAVWQARRFGVLEDIERWAAQGLTRIQIAQRLRQEKRLGTLNQFGARDLVSGVHDFVGIPAEDQRQARAAWQQQYRAERQREAMVEQGLEQPPLTPEQQALEDEMLGAIETPPVSPGTPAPHTPAPDVPRTSAPQDVTPTRPAPRPEPATGAPPAPGTPLTPEQRSWGYQQPPPVPTPPQTLTPMPTPAASPTLAGEGEWPTGDQPEAKWGGLPFPLYALGQDVRVFVRDIQGEIRPGGERPGPIVVPRNAQRLQERIRDAQATYGDSTDEAVQAQLRTLQAAAHRLDQVLTQEAQQRQATLEARRAARAGPGAPTPLEAPAPRVRASDDPFAGSKVVDAEGGLKRVYHGSNSPFTEFDPTYVDTDALYGPGFYFTENPTVASGYTGEGEILRFTPAQRHWFRRPGRALPAVGDEWGGSVIQHVNELPDGSVELTLSATEGGNVRPAYVNIQQPFDLEQRLTETAAQQFAVATGMREPYVAGALSPARRVDGMIEAERLYDFLVRNYGGDKSAAQRALQAAGYDGLTHIGGDITGGEPHRVWIAFHPSQVRPGFASPGVKPPAPLDTPSPAAAPAPPGPGTPPAPLTPVSPTPPVPGTPAEVLYGPQLAPPGTRPRQEPTDAREQFAALAGQDPATTWAMLRTLQQAGTSRSEARTAVQGLGLTSEQSMRAVDLAYNALARGQDLFPEPGAPAVTPPAPLPPAPPTEVPPVQPAPKPVPEATIANAGTPYKTKQNATFALTHKKGVSADTHEVVEREGYGWFIVPKGSAVPPAPSVDMPPREEPVPTTTPGPGPAPVAERQFYPDGRSKPQGGEEVYQQVRGFGGTPAYIHGVVYRDRKGNLRVRVTDTAAMIGSGPAQGKTYPLDGNWTLRGDPLIAQREAAAKAEAEAQQATRKAEEDKRAAWSAAHGIPADPRRPGGPADPQAIQPGDVLEHYDGSRVTIARLDPEEGWPLARDERGEWTIGRVDLWRKTGERATPSPEPPTPVPEPEAEHPPTPPVPLPDYAQGIPEGAQVPLVRPTAEDAERLIGAVNEDLQQRDRQLRWGTLATDETPAIVGWRERILQYQRELPAGQRELQNRLERLDQGLQAQQQKIANLLLLSPEDQANALARHMENIVSSGQGRQAEQGAIDAMTGRAAELLEEGLNPKAYDRLNKALIALRKRLTPAAPPEPAVPPSPAPSPPAPSTPSGRWQPIRDNLYAEVRQVLATHGIVGAERLTRDVKLGYSQAKGALERLVAEGHGRWDPKYPDMVIEVVPPPSAGEPPEPPEPAVPPSPAPPAPTAPGGAAPTPQPVFKAGDRVSYKANPDTIVEGVVLQQFPNGNLRVQVERVIIDGVPRPHSAHTEAKASEVTRLPSVGASSAGTLAQPSAPPQPMERPPRGPAPTAAGPGPGPQPGRVGGPGTPRPAPLAGVPPEDVRRPSAERPLTPDVEASGDAGPSDDQLVNGPGDELPGGVGDSPARNTAAERRGRAGSEPRARATQAGGKPGHDYVITDPAHLIPGGAKSRYHANVAAIRLLKELDAAERRATPDEQEILVQYTGWGAIPQVFDTKYERSYNAGGEWAKEYAELKELLTPEEWDRANASTPNAHYTSPEVIEAIYSGLLRLGFTGGRVLEPSMGTGNFFGAMPNPMRSESKLTGIELDSLTGRIARQLYQSAGVHIKGLQEVPLSDNFFDLAVSNVPFGNYKVHDPKYNRLNLSIHNYFFAKALDKVRPGGIVAFVTSPFTLDALDPTAREYLASKAELLGAIRLPQGTFTKLAGTDTTTDILFLQKRGPGVQARESWTDVEDLPESDLHINEYFVRHPEMMLGAMAMTGRMYAAGASQALVAPEGQDLSAALSRAMQRLPEQALTPREATPAATPARTAEAFEAGESSLREHAYLVKEGVIYQRKGTEFVPVEGVGATQAARITGMAAIRDAFRHALAVQYREASDAEVEAALADLNRVYDTFTTEYGPLTKPGNPNIAAFADDPDLQLVLALEQWNPETQTATKAPQFHQRTVRRPVAPSHVDDPTEALKLTLGQKGDIDWRYMVQVTGQPAGQLQTALAGQVYQNPNGGG